MSRGLEPLLTTIVRGLVDEPDSVEVSERRRGRSITLDVRVQSSDRGHVIGRGGATATAIRTLLSGLVARGERVEVEIQD